MNTSKIDRSKYTEIQLPIDWDLSKVAEHLEDRGREGYREKYNFNGCYLFSMSTMEEIIERYSGYCEGVSSKSSALEWKVYDNNIFKEGIYILKVKNVGEIKTETDYYDADESSFDNFSPEEVLAFYGPIPEYEYVKPKMTKEKFNELLVEYSYNFSKEEWEDEYTPKFLAEIPLSNAQGESVNVTEYRIRRIPGATYFKSEEDCKKFLSHFTNEEIMEFFF